MRKGVIIIIIIIIIRPTHITESILIKSRTRTIENEYLHFK